MSEQEIAELKDRVGYSCKSQQWQYGFDLACRELNLAPEGFALVPVELTYRQAMSIAQAKFAAASNSFNYEYRHLSNEGKAEIKGRWIGSKAFVIQDEYKAMIKAAQENDE